MILKNYHFKCPKTLVEQKKDLEEKTTLAEQ